MSSGWRIATVAHEAHVVYLGMGSNVGDRRAHLAAALAALDGPAQLDAVSSVYESEPVGHRAQPDFWNLVARAHTRLEPADLMRELKRIEARMGRTPTFAGGPREIDIDLLLYDDLELETDDLVIPHPRMHQRAFVLRPLSELAPALRLPDGQSVSEILEAGTFERVRGLFAGETLVSGAEGTR